MRLAAIFRNFLFGRHAQEYRDAVHDNQNALHVDSGNVWRGSKHASEILRSAQGAIDLIEKSRSNDLSNKSRKIS